MVFGGLHHAALSRRDRLDPAGGPEFRLAQQGLDGADRRRARHLQHLFDGRLDPGRRRDLVSLHASCSPVRRSIWCRPRWRTRRISSAPARLRTTLRVTLPLVTPAIIGGIIISFLEAIALFGAPALIALPARFNVVSTQLWQFFEYPVRVEEAAAYAMPLLADHRADVLAAAPLLGRRGYTSVTGKGGERRMIALGPWRWVDARLCAVGLRAFGLPADAGAAAGRLRQGLGPRLHARQSDAAQFPLSAVRADPGASRPSSTPSSIRA